VEVLIDFFLSPYNSISQLVGTGQRKTCEKITFDIEPQLERQPFSVREVIDSLNLAKESLDDVSEPFKWYSLVSRLVQLGSYETAYFVALLGGD
jgi:hypothetical protein